MFDGSYKTFERIQRPDTIQVIATRDGRILMTREEQPGHKREYGLLGGRVDEGEGPLACAKRELLEEAGLVSRDWEMLKIYEPVIKMQWRVYFYIARNCSKMAEPRLESGERIEVLDVSFEEFIEITSSAYWGGEFVSDILRMRLKGELGKFRKKLFI